MTDTEKLHKALLNAINRLSEKEAEINDANVFPVPDGDTGTNMLLTLKNAVKGTENETALYALASRLSYNILRSARGNSGVILSAAVGAFFSALPSEAEDYTVSYIATGLVKAAHTALSTVASPENGTVLTLLSALADTALGLSESSSDCEIFCGKLLIKAKDVLMNDCCKIPSQKKKGVPDSGALGLYYILEGMIAGTAVTSEFIYAKAENDGFAEETDEESSKTYCTQFVVTKKELLTEEAVHVFCERVKELGESSVIVENDGIIKVHTHTDIPGDILNLAVAIGEMSEIEIDNMRLQMMRRKKSGCAVISAASGEGAKLLMKNLGASDIIEAGESFNPDTSSFIEAAEKLSAGTVFILPNHRNAILAAKQAGKLISCETEIIPTENIGQGIAALMSFSSSLTAEENSRNMHEAIKDVKSATVNRASKDAVIGISRIKKGHYIGLSGGRLTANESTLALAAAKTARSVFQKNTGTITVIYGHGVSKTAAEEIKEKIMSGVDRKTDIILLDGGQKVYELILTST